MTRITFIYAGLFILIGVCFYVGSGMASMTALIPPVAIGLIFLLIAWAGMYKRLHMHVMHLAVLFGLILFIAFVSNYGPALDYLGGNKDIERPLAYLEKSVLSLAGLSYVVVGLISFINARIKRNRKES